MKGKATGGWKRMHLLSDLMENRSYKNGIILSVVRIRKIRNIHFVGNLIVDTESFIKTASFLQRAQCSHSKRCISYGNSVRLSVRHTPVLCQNDGT